MLKLPRVVMRSMWFGISLRRQQRLAGALRGSAWSNSGTFEHAVVVLPLAVQEVAQRLRAAAHLQAVLLAVARRRSASSRGSSYRLKLVTLSCVHVPAGICERKHCTVLTGVDVVAAVVPVRQPRYAVG